MAIKFFRDFSLEGDIYKLVYTQDNFNDWLIENPGKDSSEFNKQIHNSLEQLGNIPDKTVISQKSLDDYLSNFGVYKNAKIREKVVKLILREYKPKDIFKAKDKPFDWTEFIHAKVDDGDRWIYNDITIIRPDTWESFNKLDEINMPENINMRRKYNYKDFYGEKGFERYAKTYGIAFYFVNYGGNGSENDNSKTLLFMVIPHQINFDLVPRIKYNSILLNHNSFMDSMYVMGEEKPDHDDVVNLVRKYDLEHLILPYPIEDNILKKIFRFKFK